MKYVVMTKTETIATAKGPMVLPKDGKPKLVKDWIAASLMGRGYAIETDADGNPVAELAAEPTAGESVTAETVEAGNAAPQGEVVALDSLNIAELRDLAKQRNIPDYKKLKKAELLDALKASIAAPPASSFEPISTTGGKTPPVFKAE
jgi:hypothetical protein